MSSIIPFDFETNAVRVVMHDEAPWFVAADVCRVLEHSNPTVALSRLGGDEKAIIDPKKSLGSSVARGGAQMMNIISESGLYALIFTSNKPAAQRFRKWVTAEVLPAIRQDGAYHFLDQGLREKRAYFAGLKDVQKQTAQRKAEAVAQVDALIAQGWGRTEASQEVAAALGVSERTIWYYRNATYMVPSADHAVALGRKAVDGRGGRLADCHPEFLRLYVDGVLAGHNHADCYRSLMDMAAQNGWSPVPSERTMRRRVDRLFPKASNQKSLY